MDYQTFINKNSENENLTVNMTKTKWINFFAKSIVFCWFWSWFWFRSWFSFSFWSWYWFFNCKF